mgnify:CR=1 FL=1|jgi:uncharacterized protein (DUF736 family)|tara:strand:+ start:3942 stop:4127 length:186 start_codon:yes stop_codon:yes gene_type:complete
MPFEIREGSGSIFENDKKVENAPDYTGTFKLDGKLYSIALWNKVGKSGTQYQSVKVQPKEQ